MVFYSDGLVDWELKLLISLLIELAESFCMLLWSLWRERNARVWSSTLTDAAMVVRLSGQHLVDWKEARHTAMVKVRRVHCKSWHRPLMSFLN